MKNKILATLGIVIGFISVYPVVGWIYVFNVYSSNSQLEKRSIYFKTILFGVNPDYSKKIQLVFILFGIISLSIFTILLKSDRLLTYEKSRRNLYFTLFLILLIVFSIFTFLNILFIL